MADLRAVVDRYPRDSALKTLVQSLQGVSDRFRALWTAEAGSEEAAQKKTTAYPELGEILLNCDTFTARESDLNVPTCTPQDQESRSKRELATTLRVDGFHVGSESSHESGL